MLGKNLIEAAAGNAGAGGLGIEDVFSTWLYTGNSSTQTITNGIDLAGEGGLVWIKSRNQDFDHTVVDTARGGTKRIAPNLASAESTESVITSFGSNGFTLGTGFENPWNQIVPATNYASWTFRKAPGFFDVVTYTGTGTSGLTVSHNLGSVPGFIIIKNVDETNAWNCWHRSIASPESNWWQNYLTLNTTNSAASWTTGLISEPTSTSFQVGTGGGVNNNGVTYVAYLFAHDEQIFGEGGDQSVIKCGITPSISGFGTATINLGWEPQFLLVKPVDRTGNWITADNMRGLYPSVSSPTGAPALSPNLSSAESTASDTLAINSTGFIQKEYTGGATRYIYIAIRRGPMKTPTDATEVFAADVGANVGANGEIFTSGFPVDLLMRTRKADGNNITQSRLTGGRYLRTYSTNAEGPALGDSFDSMSGINYASGGDFTNWIGWMFRRAPGFFDVVAYTGNGTNRTVAHNLGVAPELMIVKQRNSGRWWPVYSASLTYTHYINLQGTAAASPVVVGFELWNNTAPTSSVFSVGPNTAVNQSGGTYIAYLFATLPGVSKVGSYTGTGTTLNIDCGFTSGARFVLIKRTDSTGDWYVWDTARGIVSGNDPYLLLNSTAAEVTSTDYIDPLSSGFQISSTAPTAINASGGSFIFLAIA